MWKGWGYFTAAVLLQFNEVITFCQMHFLGQSKQGELLAAFSQYVQTPVMLDDGLWDG